LTSGIDNSHAGLVDGNISVHSSKQTILLSIEFIINIISCEEIFLVTTLQEIKNRQKKTKAMQKKFIYDLIPTIDVIENTLSVSCLDHP